MRQVEIQTPIVSCGRGPINVYGAPTRETARIDGFEVELFQATGRFVDSPQAEELGDGWDEPVWAASPETDDPRDWSTDPRDVLPNGKRGTHTYIHTLYECYCGVLVRKDNEPCLHCEAEGITDYPAPDCGKGQPEIPPMTDAEALAAIKRLRRYDDDLKALAVNYQALKKETEGKRERFLALEGERLQAWTASKLKGRRRSVRTLEGVAAFRTVPARVKVTDEAAALEWAREHGYTNTIERIQPLLPKHLDYTILDTGEVRYAPPPGVIYEPERTVFSVKSGVRANAEGEEQDDDE